jgi:hypothetical protein
MRKMMTMKPILLAAVLIASAATAQTASVGPSTIPGATREQKLMAITAELKKMDVNGDERIAKDEWLDAGGKAAGFETLDTNRDDVLTLQELRSNARKLRAFQDFEAAPAH